MSSMHAGISSGDDRPPLKVQNIVATFQLGRDFTGCYVQLAQNGVNTEYNPRRFHSIIIRVRLGVGVSSAPGTFSTTALIFKNGKVVLIGARTQAAALRTAHRVCRSLNASLLKISPPSLLEPPMRSGTAASTVRICTVNAFRVRNIVGSCSLARPINLNRIYDDWKISAICRQYIQSAKLDGTIFPALRLKIQAPHQSPKQSALLFHSGKIIITGSRTLAQLDFAHLHLLQLVSQYCNSRD